MESFNLSHLLGEVELKIIWKIAEGIKEEIISDFKNKKEERAHRRLYDLQNIPFQSIPGAKE